MPKRTRILAAVIGLVFAVSGAAQGGQSKANADAPESAKGKLDEFIEARSARHYANVPRKVLAFYYTWYGTPEGHGQWTHWEGVKPGAREIASSTHYPTLGAYDCYDPKVIGQHIAWAKRAGVDGFICTWWLQRDIHDRALEKVLDIAAKENFEITVYWETARNAQDDTVKRAVDDLVYVLNKYGSHPAFLKLDGKPVIFVYGRVMGEVRPEQWPEIVTAVQRRYGKDFLLIAGGYREQFAQAFDGIHTYNFAGAIKGKSPDEMREWARKSFTDAVQMARKHQKIACLTVLPGYDDTKIRKPGLVAERHDGQTYRVLWEEAIAAKPDWVLITSWNEWHEGSEIEPSVEDGEKYLALTESRAKQFKKGPSDK